MKKIAIVVGTRPNFIKITQFDKEFAKYPGLYEYRLIHTGQHYDKQMSDIFFEQFQLKRPDLTLSIKGRIPAQQIAKIIEELSAYFEHWKPDLLIVVGDVNSTLAAAIAGNKCGIRLAHLESGLRSKDRKMPEEVNRVLTDAMSDEYFVTEKSGIENLEKELNCQGRHHFVGNTMIDTLVAFDDAIASHKILEELSLNKEYALMTMHRPQNVDQGERLEKMIEIIAEISTNFQVVFPIHPRTLKNLYNFNLRQKIDGITGLQLTGPLNYLAFQKLIMGSSFVITDSGGIQEETTFRKVPCLTLRPNTERPSTVDVGSNSLLGFEKELVLSKVQEIKSGTYKESTIPELWDGKATTRIVQKIEEILF